MSPCSILSSSEGDAEPTNDPNPTTDPNPPPPPPTLQQPQALIIFNQAPPTKKEFPGGLVRGIPWGGGICQTKQTQP